MVEISILSLMLMLLALSARFCEAAMLTVDSCKVSVSKFSDDIDVSFPKSMSTTQPPVLKKTATLKVTLEMHAKMTSKALEEERANGAQKKDRTLDQVMLLLEEAGDKRDAEGVSAIFAGKKEASSVDPEDESVVRYTYSIHANPSRLVKMLRGQEGDYAITVVVGDKTVTNSFEWKLGVVTIQMEITGSREEKKKAANVLRAMTTMKPEIQHTFREDEKRAPTPISYAFVAAIFAALPLLIILVSSTSSSLFDRFPSTIGGIASSLAFHACTLLCMYVLLQFFKRQYIFEHLSSIVGAGLLASLFGFQLLSYLATARLAENSEAVTEARRKKE